MWLETTASFGRLGGEAVLAPSHASLKTPYGSCQKAAHSTPRHIPLATSDAELRGPCQRSDAKGSVGLKASPTSPPSCRGMPRQSVEYLQQRQELCQGGGLVAYPVLPTAWLPLSCFRTCVAWSLPCVIHRRELSRLPQMSIL